MHLQNLPKKIYISRIWALENARGELVFAETTEDRVAHLVGLLSGSDVPADYLFTFRTVSYDERASTGYTHDKAWSLKVSDSTNWFSDTSICDLYSTDRTSLTDIARTISHALPKFHVTLERWARIRWIMVNGALFRDFPEVPYTNVHDEDWV